MLCVSEVMVHPNHPLTFGDWIPRDVYTVVDGAKKNAPPSRSNPDPKAAKKHSFLMLFVPRCRYQESSNGPMDKMGTCIDRFWEIGSGDFESNDTAVKIANLGMNEHVRNDVAIEFLVILGSWLLYTNKNIKESQA